MADRNTENPLRRTDRAIGVRRANGPGFRQGAGCGRRILASPLERKRAAFHARTDAQRILSVARDALAGELRTRAERGPPLRPRWLVPLRRVWQRIVHDGRGP